MAERKKREIDEIIPPKFYLSQNYPNPFQGTTTIKYCVGHRVRVLLTIHNPEREIVNTLINEVKEPGTYKIEIDSRADTYMQSGGTFYYRLIAGNYTDEKKMKVIN